MWEISSTIKYTISTNNNILSTNTQISTHIDLIQQSECKLFSVIDLGLRLFAYGRNDKEYQKIINGLTMCKRVYD